MKKTKALDHSGTVSKACIIFNRKQFLKILGRCKFIA